MGFDQFQINREELASLIHEKWSEWAQQIFANPTPEKIQEWALIADTPFRELNVNERSMFFTWADSVMMIYADLIINSLSAQFRKWEKADRR